MISLEDMGIKTIEHDGDLYMQGESLLAMMTVYMLNMRREATAAEYADGMIASETIRFLAMMLLDAMEISEASNEKIFAKRLDSLFQSE